MVHSQREIQLRAVASSKVLASFPLPDSARKKVTGGGKYWEYRVAFSADGKTLLLGTAGGIIHQWEVADGKELQALNKQSSVAVAGMHTLPDGRTVVSTWGDGVIRRWDLKAGKEVMEAETYEGRSAAAYSPEGRFVAVGDARGRIDLWDGRNGKLIRTIQREGAGVWRLAFSPSGERLAAAEQSGTVRFWQVPSGQPGDVWQREPEANVWCCNGIHFSPDGRFLCVSDYPMQIRVIEVAGGKLLWKCDGASHGEAFSPDGTTLLVARTGPYLARLGAANGEQRSKVRMNLPIPDNLGIMAALALSADGRRLAVAHDDGSLLLCDGRTCVETRRLAEGGDPRMDLEVQLKGTKPRNQFRALAFSPDGKWLASAGTDAAVYVWEAATGKEVLRLAGHEAEVLSVAFSPDGQKVFSYGADGQGYLWSLKRKPAAGRQEGLRELWTDLAGTDASKAHWAVRTMSEDPVAVEFLRKQLFPAALPDGPRVAKLIADLDSENFDVREKAGLELERLEALAEAPLRKALSARPSPEVQRRAEALLGALSAGVAPTTLRNIRVAAVLEYIDTPEARQLLETLARGTPEAGLTQETKASLERLSKRHSVKP
jgi:WD40 repeat protein